MNWKIRRYGRSYIYDRLHRGAVVCMILLSGIGLVNVSIMAFPIIEKHLRGETGNKESSSK